LKEQRDAQKRVNHLVCLLAGTAGDGEVGFSLISLAFVSLDSGLHLKDGMYVLGNFEKKVL